jgi:hypothetical protein
LNELNTIEELCFAPEARMEGVAWTDTAGCAFAFWEGLK